MIHLLDSSSKTYSPKFYYSKLMHKKSEFDDVFSSLGTNFKTNYGISESYPDCLIFEILIKHLNKRKSLLKKKLNLKLLLGLT